MSKLFQPPTVFSTTCETTGTEIAVSVALPSRYEKLEAVPLVLCLDAPWTFGTTVDATRIMSMSGEAPEAIVVGLAFCEDRASEYFRERARWFTPTPWVPPEISGVKDVEASECGRALEHWRFIGEQLLPRLLTDYRVSERWFFGHSFAALFGLRRLFDEPTTFDKWLLASPSIWWDERSILSFEKAYAESHPDLQAKVIMTVGEQEAAMFDETFGMVRNAKSLTDTLNDRKYPNLGLINQVLPGEGHSSTIGASISFGLRMLMLNS